MGLNKLYNFISDIGKAYRTKGAAMDTRAFEYINAIAKYRNISKAADALFISQPALSQYIKKLEDSLGVPLLDRGSNSTETLLTPPGEVFSRRGKQILDLYDILLQNISEYSLSHTGRIRFGIPPFYSKFYLPALLPSFNEKFPYVKVTIIEGQTPELELLMTNGKLDFCLLPVYSQDCTLDYHLLRDEEILLAVSENSKLLSFVTYKDNFPLLDLTFCREEPFVFLTTAQKFHMQGLQACEQAGFIPHIVCEVMDWDTLDALIANKMGIGFVPDIFLEKSTSKNLYCRFFNGNKLTRQIALVSKKSYHSSSCEEFKKFVIATIGKNRTKMD